MSVHSGRFRIVISALTLLTSSALLAQSSDAESLSSEMRLSVLSPVYHVNGIYKSMKGPSSTLEVALQTSAKDALYWINGFKAEMVGADGKSTISQEFMCHSNLDLDIHQRRVRGFATSQVANPRLFTLSQGQFEINFPAGFALPVLADESLSLTTQVLNHNVTGKTFDVRHHVEISYSASRDGAIPLFSTAAYGLARLDQGSGLFGIHNPDSNVHGPGCLPGSNASDMVYKDGLGAAFSGHWVVKPGREERTTLVTEIMDLPFDTTVHYIAVHLHPFAESVELVDLTSGETLFVSAARNAADKIGLEHVDHYSSASGFEVYTDHQYQLISRYNNTSGEDQDSMAVMYLYLRDKRFEASLDAATGDLASATSESITAAASMQH